MSNLTAKSNIIYKVKKTLILKHFKYESDNFETPLLKY